jgi:hypothetical protein
MHGRAHRAEDRLPRSDCEPRAYFHADGELVGVTDTQREEHRTDFDALVAAPLDRPA